MTTVIICVFIITWNYVESFRLKSQVFLMETFSVNIADHIPVWTKKSKAFQKRASTDLAAISQQDAQEFGGGAATGGVIDPLYLAVVSGLWPQVESFNASRCARWQSSHECGVRAFYFAYRGMRSSLKPLQTIDVSPRSGLSTRDQGIFLFAKSAALTGPESERMFKEAIDVVGSDKLVSRMLIDARFKALLREGRQKEISSMIGLVAKLSMGAADVGKWKALELSTRWKTQVDASQTALKAQASKQIAVVTQKYPGVLKADPVGFLMISGPALRLGFAKPISLLSGMMAVESSKLPFDPTLRRGLSEVYARASLLEGNPVQAEERLLAAQKQDGSDAVLNHLLGSALLEARNGAKILLASRHFQSAFQARGSWQSGYGYSIALIRSGRLADAGKVMVTLRRLRTASNEIWINIALADYNLAVAKASGDWSTARYREVANSLSRSYALHPDWPTLARLYSEAMAGSGQRVEAAKIRAKMDDVSSKTSYLSSPELAESPIGPLALLK